jgi:hypothetical protein
MKYLCILLTLLTGCTSGKIITANKFVLPPVVSQPDIVEPISVVFDEFAPPEVEHVNNVFLDLTLLVMFICILSILPKLITYLKARRGRCSTDQDTE